MANIEYVLIFHGGKHAGVERTTFRCPTCSRLLFKHNSTRIEISNAYGIGSKEIMAGSSDEDGKPVFIDLRCHNCKSLFKILFR